MGNQQVSTLGTILIPIPESDVHYTDVLGNIFSFAKGGKERILSEHLSNCKNKKKRVRVKVGNKFWLKHRYIASVLIGRHLTQKEVVNHKDGNPLNNNLDNLEIVSQEYNVYHAVENNLYCSGHSWYKARGLATKCETSSTIPRGSRIK